MSWTKVVFIHGSRQSGPAGSAGLENIPTWMGHLENIPHRPSFLPVRTNHPLPSSRSSNTNLLARPSGITSNFTSGAFSVSAPSTWNSPRPTQPPTLSGTGNEYQPKCSDALRLGSKGRYGSFHLWTNVWVAGKTVIRR